MRKKNHRISTTSSPAHLFATRGRWKRPWNTSKKWLKFSQIGDIFFRITYEIRGRRYRKYEQRCCDISQCLVCKGKNEKKNKTYEQKAILASLSTHMFFFCIQRYTAESSYKFVCWYGQGHINIAISFWFELCSIFCEWEMNKQALQAGESWL